METKPFLDELLQAGRGWAKTGQKMAEEKLNIAEEGDERQATLDGMKKGAMAVGALALLLGTSTGRKFTGTALKLGSVAAVGSFAWTALQNWQAQQAEEQAQAKTEQEARAEDVTKVLTIDKLEGEAADERSLILIKAMIAAAKSDGNFSESEEQIITEQITKLGLGKDLESVMHSGMVKPLSAKAVAKMADSKEIASEIYLVSILVTDLENEKEKSYMNALAKALELPEQLKSELDNYRK